MPNPDTREDWTAEDWREWGVGRHALVETLRRKLAEAERRVQELEEALRKLVFQGAYQRSPRGDEVWREARAALEAARKQP